jgi:hypothetical protein
MSGEELFMRSDDVYGREGWGIGHHVVQVIDVFMSCIDVAALDVVFC